MSAGLRSRCSPQALSALHPEFLLSCQKEPKAPASPLASGLSFGRGRKVRRDLARSVLSPRLQRPSLGLGFPAVLVPGGCGIELPALTAFAPVRQQSRVSTRSALRARPPALRSSAPTNGATAGKRRCQSKSGLFGIRLLAPFVGAEQHSRPRRGRQPASSTDSARLSDRSERSERREFRAGWGWRAAQGTPGAARGAEAGASAFPPFWQDKRGSGAGVKPLRALTNQRKQQQEQYP